jgi:signal peptidase II
MRQTAHRFLQPLTVLLVFAADRATKLWAVGWLQERSSVKVLPFLHFSYVENTGAAWGILQHNNAILIAVTIVLLGALLHLRRRWPSENLPAHYGMVLVAGGALGNLYDRLTLGCVVDFIDFLVWPVFNVADSCITVGAVLMAWGMRERKD